MDQSKNKILVAVNLEKNFDIIIEQSYSIARVFDAEILLLFVIEDAGGLSRYISPEDHMNQIMGHARKRFDEIESLVENYADHSQIPVSYILKKGKVYDQIIETAFEQNVILIIMGVDDGDTKRKRRFVGSNTLNVVREAPCPVITIKGDKAYQAFRNILVPLDLTGHTKKQIQKAIEFGKFFGADIHLVSVISEKKKITGLLKTVQINQVRNAISRHGIKCTSEILRHPPKGVSQSICNVAAHKNSDLIIIMTTQKRHFSRFFIGAIAQEIIFMACVPVLSLAPRAEFKPYVVTSFLDPLNLLQHKPDFE